MQNWLRIQLSFFFLILIGFQSNAFALERWYRIEILVIEHKDKSGILLEEWPLDPGYPKVRRANYVQKLTDDANPSNFIQLAENELDLLDARKKLIKNAGSKILLHTGWRQLVKEDNPEPVRFTSDKSFSYKTPDGSNFNLAEFDGTLSILLTRYLHVLTDMVFHKPMEIVKKESSYGHDLMQKLKPLDSENNWESNKSAGLQRFRVKTSRKVKKNDVTYIDHPMYGILIKVSDDKREATS